MLTLGEKPMTEEEWKELNDLRAAISEYPASVVPEKQERFTELLVKSWSYVDNVPKVDSLTTVTEPCNATK